MLTAMTNDSAPRMPEEDAPIRFQSSNDHGFTRSDRVS